MSRAADFLARFHEGLVVNGFRIAVLGHRRQGQKISGWRRAHMCSVDWLLGIAQHVCPGVDLLTAEILRFSWIANHADELAWRQRIDHFAPRLGIGSNRPLLGKPDLAYRRAALGHPETGRFEQRCDLRRYAARRG